MTRSPHPSPAPDAASVLQVGEAALTAATLEAEARSRGLRWDHLPLASNRREWSGVLGQAQRAALGVPWLARLAVGARTHDIVHVHSATTVRHSRVAAPRYVLHCHGSDVRSAQYDSAAGASVRRALAEAEAVVFSTPDLVEHVLPHRPDATYVPVPVSTDAVPAWRPPLQRPRVAFASRWEDVKGLRTQVDVARGLVAALAGRAEVVGLDWGPGTDAARAAGVRLAPRMGHDDYLRWLATSTAVVGQAAGILSASELEAMAAGTPLLVPSSLGGYAGLAGSPPPVLAADVDAVVEAAVAYVDDPQRHDPQPARAWVRREHGAGTVLDRVLEVHTRVLAAR
ncbi:hypothetical protein GCM10023153_00120 [Ornithinibacter aureus]|uniref:D-inositol 3-phosphate glycosyltransferase n=1 Tax=Ornithinibacter aureus TaxID=622664 RepID=A0ABP8J7I7_9MICO|nr:hypothetical protein [Ornithinibacter aureus]KAF0835419.1 glycosyltransferase involved in cell wall biosynthesis [Ornithinibacter aureus]